VEERRSSQRHESRRALAEICPAATKMAGCGNYGVSGGGRGLPFPRELAVADFGEARCGGPAYSLAILPFHNRSTDLSIDWLGPSWRKC